MSRINAPLVVRKPVLVTSANEPSSPFYPFVDKILDPQKRVTFLLFVLSN